MPEDHEDPMAAQKYGRLDAAAAAHHPHQQVPPPPHAGQHASELGDMLSMLGQNAASAAGHHAGFAAASAENLGGMFTGQFQ